MWIEDKLTLLPHGAKTHLKIYAPNNGTWWVFILYKDKESAMILSNIATQIYLKKVKGGVPRPHWTFKAEYASFTDRIIYETPQEYDEPWRYLSKNPRAWMAERMLQCG